jgi:hypothetical protein
VAITSIIGGKDMSEFTHVLFTVEGGKIVRKAVLCAADNKRAAVMARALVRIYVTDTKKSDTPLTSGDFHLQPYPFKKG